MAEAGILEAQARLLCASIRRFGGGYSGAAITVVSPRRSRRPSRATLRELQRLGAEFLPLSLSSPCPQYGPSYRVLAAAHVARRPGPPILVQIDSDTVFLREPDFSLRGVDAAARPVDVKGMCTSGSGDPFDTYWRNLCRLCEVDYDLLPMVQTTVDRQAVRASYNGGLVAARRTSGIFERTADFFIRLAGAQLKPWLGADTRVRSGTGVVDARGGAYWGTSQAALSLAITARAAAVQMLPATYNVPLHYVDVAGFTVRAPVRPAITGCARQARAAAIPCLTGGSTCRPKPSMWLRERLPLQPDRAWWRRLLT